MTALDAIIVVLSLLGLVVFAGRLASRQQATGDYYLGGHRLPGWMLGASLAANQVSAISLVGAPAFVALREGGGLVWLQYELAVPLALAALVAWGVPLLRSAPGADVYGVVELRLGRGARRTLAGFFLLGRGLGAGVVVYASALVVAACTGQSSETALLVVGAVAVAYTTLGGFVADVFSDVIQLGLLWAGTLVATLFLAFRLWGAGATIPPERLLALDFSGHGLGDGATFAFWPMLCGGFFLYLSYYGCDQTQAQRILAAADERAAERALTVAALIRFPLVASYCLFGVLLAGLLSVDVEFAASLAGRSPDALVPQFIVSFLPAGLLGIAVAGILAAALSSIDSALNSLSAVTVEEFVPASARQAPAAGLRWARLGSLAWGVWATAAGFWFSRSAETVIELVNRVGSLVYGPMLALFVLCRWPGRADGRSSVVGALAGVGANALFAAFVPSVSWLWWNVIGCAVALLSAAALGRNRPATSSLPTRRSARRLPRILLLEFCAILGILLLLGWADG